MKYLIKANYKCPEIRLKKEKWFIDESSEKPKIGDTKKSFLPHHKCQKDNYSENCENDPDCNTQIITDVRPFSKGEIEKLILEEELVLQTSTS